MQIQKAQLKKIPQIRATEILSRYQQDRKLKSQIDPDLTPVELMNHWLSQKKWQLVIVFLCHALPAKECIWWGYQCLNTLEEEELPAVDKAALNSVELWLKNSSEVCRRRSALAAEQAGLETPSGLLAQAVFWSGGSITALDEPECPAPDYLYSHTVAAAIYTSALLPAPDSAENKLKQTLEHGFRIADGGT